MRTLSAGSAELASSAKAHMRELLANRVMFEVCHEVPDFRERAQLLGQVGESADPPAWSVAPIAISHYPFTPRLLLPPRIHLRGVARSSPRPRPRPSVFFLLMVTTNEGQHSTPQKYHRSPKELTSIVLIVFIIAHRCLPLRAAILLIVNDSL